MRALASTGSRVRAGALLALGALAVHQLRYLLVTGEIPGAAHAHAYLGLLAPVAVAAATAAIALSLLAAASRRADRSSLRLADTTERAALYALGLLAAYFVQELAEGVLVAGHGGPLAAGAGAGGWLVLPLAVAFGALAALAGRWLDRVESSLGAAPRRRRRRAPARLGRPRSRRGRALASLTLAFGLARRPPPLAPSFAD